MKNQFHFKFIISIKKTLAYIKEKKSKNESGLILSRLYFTFSINKNNKCMLSKYLPAML
jgi:hypothetical protein